MLDWIAALKQAKQELLDKAEEKEKKKFEKKGDEGNEKLTKFMRVDEEKAERNKLVDVVKKKRKEIASLNLVYEKKKISEKEYLEKLSVLQKILNETVRKLNGN